MNKSNTFRFLPKGRKPLTLILLIGISCLSISFLTTILNGPGLLAPKPIGSFLNNKLPSNSTGTPPQFLSQTGAFSNLSSLTPSSGVLPYDMIEPFWSDGADKHRWMAIPNNGTHNTAGEKINFSADGNWEFPIGAVLIKHFELGGKRLETRFEVRATDGSYYYLTYKWNNLGTEATLLTTGLDETIVVNGQAQVWHYPSPTECLDCHKQEVGFVLGPKTRNLNSSITYPSTGIEANQLVTLSHLGIIDESITDSNADNFMAVAAHDDLNYSLEYRARSYIDVNCSYCHQPATNIGQFDARITTPLSQQNIINGPVAYDIGLTDPSVIVPQNITQSVLHNRMNSLQTGVAMPPLAKNEIHQEGVQLIAEWINSISIDANNTEPVALFSASVLSGIGPLNVSFDATNSYDPDLGDLVYSWDFGDEIAATGIIVNHTYTNSGTYEATLTVNDGQNSGQKTVTIIVHDNPTNTAIVSFSDETNLLSTANYSGVSMSVVDMNGDGKDDIVRYDNGKLLNVKYQQGVNQAFTSVNFGAVSTEVQWSNTIADVNQDGYNDILTAGYYDEIKLLYNNTGQSYNSTIIPNSRIFIQGSNFVDIDNDGWVDVFACYDHGDNREFRNEGNGTFTFSPDMLDTKTLPISDNSGNYASIWTDYDNDGDIDLYISKCRSGSVSSTDPRRVNMLFQNDGNNNYTEVAAAANLNIGAQSWLTDFGDIDNDGDMDCIVINHYSVSNLMRNNGNGTFTDVTNGSGLLSALNGRLNIQAFFRDFNNDGFVDLLVSGEKHCLFYNDGDGTFTQAANPFNANPIKSMAIGDLNHDGFLDVYASYLNLYNTPSDTEDRLFLNNGNNNNFIAIQLEGVESNINGIGAKIKLVGTWGEQIREVRSGEGYGVMNSFTQHFGIGTATQISKVVINWPSGTVDEINNPAPNQFLKIVEGNSTSSLCSSDNVEPNNSFNERTDLGLGDSFYQSGLCITPNDKDYFIFSSNNETYFIQVRGANGTATGQYDLSIERVGNTLSIETKSVNQSTTDTYLYLYGDNLSLLAENDNFNTTFSKINYTIPSAGGGRTVSCDGNTTITYGDGEITMSGQTGEENFFQIFDLNWKEVYNCGWQCGNTKTVSNLTAGDYRIYIKNNSYQVICDKVISLSSGGGGSTDPDNDGDGVPASIDCNDTDPNLTTTGALCNDGNANTINDVVQANCTCAGTPSGSGGTTVLCEGNTSLTFDDGSIIMTGELGQEYFFQIFDFNWKEIYNCGWQCGNTKTVSNLTAGDYRVYIKNSNYQVICDKVITLSNGTNDPDNDGDGVPASIDCNDTDPNLTTVGSNCDDGNTNTVNDVVQSNCTCSGTIPGGGNSTMVTCGDISVTYGEGIIDMIGIVGVNYFFKVFDLDNGWSQAFGCSWNCGSRQTAVDLPNGRYMVIINNEDWSEHCSVEITMTNSSFTAVVESRSAPQLNFEAFTAERTVDLQWLTNSGYKIKHFEIERSLDGINFESLQKRINKEWSEQLVYHHATDLIPTKGINYYRIKEVYLDNSFSYTDVKQVGFDVDIEKLAIYPNPVENVLSLNLKPMIGKKTKINIINGFGQVAQSVNFGIISKENEQITLNKAISNGFYHVWIEVEGERPIIKKLVVKRLY